MFRVKSGMGDRSGSSCHGCEGVEENTLAGICMWAAHCSIYRQKYDSGHHLNEFQDIVLNDHYGYRCEFYLVCEMILSYRSFKLG